jgi:acyl-ACP thioesterase
MRFPADFIAVYEESAGGRDANVRRRHPDPPDDVERSPWRFRATEMDPAGHINNSHYWVPLEEEIAEGPEPGALDAEIEYRDPALPGDAVVIREGSSMWIASGDGALHASLIRA